MFKAGSIQAVIELLMAAALWGFGFVATVWALEKLGPFELTLFRFVVAAAVGLPFLFTRAARQVARAYWRLSWIPALILVSTLIFQTWGLQFTSPTKSGFITTLYVVFVPLLEAALKKRALPRAIWFCVFLALMGTVLIVDLGFSTLNFGDVLTLICSLLATVQIYWLGEISGGIARPFVFNIYQCIWAALLSLPLVRLHGFWLKLAQFQQWPTHVVLGVLSLALGSTVIAFFLQVRAQSKISTTVSSLLFLLESPFALLFAMAFLRQTLRPLEALGALMIFCAALTASWVEGRAKEIAFVPELVNP